MKPRGTDAKARGATTVNEAERGQVAAVLLAGGLSRRMGGGDKSLRLLGGRPVLARVIDRIRPQVSALALNANGDPARFSEFGLPVIADPIAGFAGPLAGVLAGLDWAADTIARCAWLLSAPTDAPFLPEDLVSRLYAETETGAEIAVASSGGRSHPVAALWPIWLRAPLRRALENGIRKVEDFTKDYRVGMVQFSAEPVDPFFNLNRLEDLEAAERALALDFALTQRQ
jgi:molybdopterin-guanine dinucleotide biosynthesis protein A